MEVAQAILVGAVLAVEPHPTLGIEQVGHDDRTDARGVEHVHDRLRVLRARSCTAVCWRDVVAPPISSGRSIPRRSISRATSTIWSSDGVISPDSPTMSALLLDGRVEDPCRPAP